MAINPDKLNEFLGKALVDFGATFNAALIGIGDKLGLYKALAAGGPQTSGNSRKRPALQSATCANGSAAQAAGGYATYDPGTRKFHLTEEQAFCHGRRQQPSVSARCVSGRPGRDQS